MKESASTEVSLDLTGCWVHTKLTLEAIDFIWTNPGGMNSGKLAPQVGLEPTTLRLTAECSTIELLRSNGATHDGGMRRI